MTNKTAPYHQLAHVYDRMMSHVDYRGWRDYILQLIDASGKTVDSLVDLSCGTGNLLSFFKGKIRNLAGCDSSREMIEIAAGKRALSKTPLFVNDITQIAIAAEQVDCALFLYDSLNYITESSSLEKCFKEVRRILKINGMFIFDVVSIRHCREYYADFHESEYWGGEGYTRHSYFDTKNSIQHNDFRIVIRGRTFEEQHIQKIYSQSDLEKMLINCGFLVYGMYDEFTSDAAGEESGRIHFLCIKK
ncbi:MAG: class I SAM-dependent methyltransferase [Calditrichales bacterium]|nr:MAG: class I SAM-dependent methyltransferase [Calditrichales bacterium]